MAQVGKERAHGANVMQSIVLRLAVLVMEHIEVDKVPTSDINLRVALVGTSTITGHDCQCARR